MSQPNVSVAGKDLREWALIILLFVLVIAISVFMIAFVIAIMNEPDIKITGQIDLGQFTGIIIGSAMVAVVLVSQQLTAKQQQSAVQATDDVWLKEP